MKAECSVIEQSKVLKLLDEAEKIIIGLGEEWKQGARQNPGTQIREAYEALYQMTKGKDLWVVTTLTDGAVYETPFDPKRITAPCGNDHWFQCSKACTKDIWEEGEVENGLCPHCGSPLTANTVQAKPYIEEGYLPSWQAYKSWQTGTLNRKLLLLELGVGLSYPTVIRWPFEKIAVLNQKAHLLRVHAALSQLPQGMERAEREARFSPEWILSLYQLCKGQTQENQN